MLREFLDARNQCVRLKMLVIRELMVNDLMRYTAGMDEVLAKVTPLMGASKDPVEMREIVPAARGSGLRGGGGGGGGGGGDGGGSCGGGDAIGLDRGSSEHKLPYPSPQSSAASLPLPEEAPQVEAQDVRREKMACDSGEGSAPRIRELKHLVSVCVCYPSLPPSLPVLSSHSWSMKVYTFSLPHPSSVTRCRLTSPPGVVARDRAARATLRLASVERRAVA